jgi:hypothetical protein
LRISEIKPEIAKYLTGLGDVALNMKALENDLQEALSLILSNPRFSELLTTGVHLDQLLKALSAAFYSSPYKDDESITFEYLMNQILIIHSRRNDVLHGLFEFYGDGQARWEKKNKHKHGIIPKQAIEDYPISELEKLCSEINSVRDDLFSFIQALFLPIDGVWDSKSSMSAKNHYKQTLKLKAEQLYTKKNKANKKMRNTPRV